MIVLLVLIVGGFAVGVAVGRTWAFLAPVAVGVFVGATEELEVSGAFLGTAWALVGACGVAAGLGARKLLARRA